MWLSKHLHNSLFDPHISTGQGGYWYHFASEALKDSWLAYGHLTSKEKSWNYKPDLVTVHCWFSTVPPPPCLLEHQGRWPRLISMKGHFLAPKPENSVSPSLSYHLPPSTILHYFCKPPSCSFRQCSHFLNPGLYFSQVLCHPLPTVVHLSSRTQAWLSFLLRNPPVIPMDYRKPNRPSTNSSTPSATCCFLLQHPAVPMSLPSTPSA